MRGNKKKSMPLNFLLLLEICANEDQMKCQDPPGFCGWRCNGESDCNNGEDELNCGKWNVSMHNFRYKQTTNCSQFYSRISFLF